MKNNVESYYPADFEKLFGSVNDDSFTRPNQYQHSDSHRLIIRKLSWHNVLMLQKLNQTSAQVQSDNSKRNNE